ncbi:MAG: hypothetical protein ABGY41_05735, partial [Candidatus Poribacteria bacterium]
DYHRGLQDAGITYEQVPAGESAVLVEGMGPLDAARWLVEQARGKHAPEYAKLALEADPSSYEMLMIVGDYLSEQADGEAADYYRRAHELYPDRIDPLIGMARRTQKADPDQALQYLDQAGELQPNDGWVDYWKGTLRHPNGNAVDALPHLREG